MSVASCKESHSILSSLWQPLDHDPPPLAARRFGGYVCRSVTGRRYRVAKQCTDTSLLIPKRAGRERYRTVGVEVRQRHDHRPRLLYSSYEIRRGTLGSGRRTAKRETRLEPSTPFYQGVAESIKDRARKLGHQSGNRAVEYDSSAYFIHRKGNI